MAELRCRFCEKPLALMTRLAGDREFCSKEHRRNYKQQDNQLALARLLQAQSPGSKASNGNGSAASVLELKPQDSLTPQPLVHENGSKREPSLKPSKNGAAHKVVNGAAISHPDTEPVPSPARFILQDPAIPVFEALRRDVTVDSAPRWKAFTGCLPVLPPPVAISFVGPSSFLWHRTTQVAADANPDPGRFQFSLSVLPNVSRTGYLEGQLRRTERIGFCPP